MKKIIHDNDDWLLSVKEEILDPDRPIIDPHHHLWTARPNDYLLPDLWDDTESGHNIQKTVFIECHAHYLKTGPEYLRPVGETEFVTEIAEESDRANGKKAKIAGIVAHTDLTLDEDLLIEALEAHSLAGKGRFRGIRQAGAFEENNEFLFIKPRQKKGLYRDQQFQKGVAILGQHGLTYDTWHYHHQNQDFIHLANSAPDTTIILDHFGTPLGVGPYKGRREEIFQTWKKDIAEIAKCENVYAKLGGLAMPDNGFGWNLRDVPPSSDEIVDTQQRYYLHALECFGVERCLFESNFPVDKWSLSYHVVWNAFKKMTADLTEKEKHALFYENAERVYRLGD
ncbi:MAG: amidohydrolase family protein [Cellvibrionaceae bacterium]